MIVGQAAGEISLPHLIRSVLKQPERLQNIAQYKPRQEENGPGQEQEKGEKDGKERSLGSMFHGIIRTMRHLPADKIQMIQRIIDILFFHIIKLPRIGMDVCIPLLAEKRTVTDITRNVFLHAGKLAFAV